MMRRENRAVHHQGSLNVNSRDWWNHKFDTDWKDFGGNQQTQYFAGLLAEMMPEWLKQEINENRDAVCDLGCAEGDALPVYRKIFPHSEIAGEDFSKQALEKAASHYPEFSFHESDILKPEKEKPYPVVIASNTAEHFKDSDQVFESICRRAEKYAMILIPYREEPGIIEGHEKVFHTKDIPVRIGGSQLVYAQTVKCSSIYYPYEQMMLIYAKKDVSGSLADLAEHIESDKEKASQDELLQKLHAYAHELETCRAQNAEYAGRLEACQNAEAECRNQLLVEKQKNEALSYQISYAEAVKKQKDFLMQRMQSLCWYYASGKLSRLNHLLIRLKVQLMRGSRQERKNFLKWISGRHSAEEKTVQDSRRYNPWMDLEQKLQEALACGRVHGEEVSGQKEN